MKTRTTILLTAMATFTLFTLFAYCSKDEKGSNGDNGGTLSTLNLSGTTWESSNDYGVVVSLHFTTENSGYYHWIAGDDVTINFTYSLNGIHGTVNGSSEIFFPSSAVLVIIDENTIGIGGRAFTRQ